MLATAARRPRFAPPGPLRGAAPMASRLALETGLMLLGFVLAAYASSRWIHPAWSLVALLNYGWLCTLLFRLEPRGTVLLLPQLINNASAMVAMIMIEFGGEMFELGLVGQPGPWSSTLNLAKLLFCVGFIAGFTPLMRLMDRRGTLRSPVLDRYANALALAVLALIALIALALVIRGLQFGFPLLAGTDRFAFRRFAADKVTLYALNLKFVIGYALGFVAFVIPAARWLRLGAVAGFVAMMGLYFLFGDKFFTQLAALSAFGAPYLYRNIAAVRRRLWTYALIGSLALAAVMGVTTYIYSGGFTETSATTSKRLAGRIVGQGELWYLQSRIGAPLLQWNGPVLERYAAALSVKAVDLFATQNSLGAHYFSNRYAPDYLRASLHRNAGTVTYTEVAEAMGLALFGWLGLGVVMALLGALLGLASAYIAFAIEGRAIISGIFAAYVYTQLRNSIVQATPWTIGSIYSARWLGLILLIELTTALVSRNSRSGLRHSYRDHLNQEHLDHRPSRRRQRRIPARRSRGVKQGAKPAV